MPLENAMHGEATSTHPVSGPLDRWQASLTRASGEELKFSQDCLVQLDKWFNTSASTPLKVPTSALNEFIAFELSLVPEVEFVFTALRNSVLYVWVVVDKFEEKIRERIYDRERAVIDEFLSLEFDFYIVARLVRDVWDLVSEDITLAFERSP